MQPSPSFDEFLARVLLNCLDIRAVWSVGHEADESGAEEPHAPELLAFADEATLQRLRKCDDLLHCGVELLVVTDGDVFENARDPDCVPGSLARWAWREVSPQVAYYDESRWAADAKDGAVFRVRRKAVLLWRAEACA